MPRKKGRALYATPLLATPLLSTPTTVREREEQASFASRFHSTTVCILVGRECTPYHLHSELLRQKCPYFASRIAFATKSQTKTERDKEVDNIHWENLTNCAVFDLLLEYLYKDEFATPTQQSIPKKCESYAHLYRLAEYLSMSALKDTALDKLATLLKENVHGVFGRGLKPLEIILLLDIAYADDIGENDQVTWTEAGDVETQQDDETLTEISTDPRDDEDIAASTNDTQATTAEAEFEPSWPDPLQQLIARYAAVQLGTLQREPTFHQIMVDGGYMVRDIIMAAQPAHMM